MKYKETPDRIKVTSPLPFPSRRESISVFEGYARIEYTQFLLLHKKIDLRMLVVSFIFIIEFSSISIVLTGIQLDRKDFEVLFQAILGILLSL